MAEIGNAFAMLFTCLGDVAQSILAGFVAIFGGGA